MYILSFTLKMLQSLDAENVFNIYAFKQLMQ